MSSARTGSPAGSPSTTVVSSGPCDSPAVIHRNMGGEVTGDPGRGLSRRLLGRSPARASSSEWVGSLPVSGAPAAHRSAERPASDLLLSALLLLHRSLT